MFDGQRSFYPDLVAEEPRPKEGRLDDVGRRYDHYMEMLSVWRDAYDLLQSKVTNFQTAAIHAVNIAFLDCAIKTLEKQIGVMAKYDGHSKWKLQREIDGIASDPKVWKEGRGTDLKGR